MIICVHDKMILPLVHQVRLAQKIKNQGAYEYMHTLALVLEPRYLASMLFQDESWNLIP